MGIGTCFWRILVMVANKLSLNFSVNKQGILVMVKTSTGLGNVECKEQLIVS